MTTWFRVAPEGSITYDAGNMLLFQFKPGTRVALPFFRTRRRPSLLGTLTL